MDSAAPCWTEETKEKARSYAGFVMLLELLGCLNGGRRRQSHRLMNQYVALLNARNAPMDTPR
jgi:hypothetical protein